MNKKAFVLMETLVVTIFALFIFTLLYTNVVPLLGKYQELAYYNDLDTTYDLYHIKKFLKADPNYEEIKKKAYQEITCNNDTILNQENCYTLLKFLRLDEVSDEIIFLNYTNYLKDENRKKFTDDLTISNYVKDYLNYVDIKNNPSGGADIMLLILQHDGYVSYLLA